MSQIDALGHMTLNEEGAVVSSGGDMSNDEKMAEKLVALVRTMMRLHANDDRLKTSNFKRLSVVWEDFMYVITVSNHKIYAFKRRTNQDESSPVVA
jgi:hypothetical protein